MFILCRRFCGVSFNEEILGNGTKVGTSPFPFFVSVGGEVRRRLPFSDSISVSTVAFLW